MGYSFVLTESATLEFESCLPGTDFDTDTYLFAGDPCNGGTLLFFDDGISGWKPAPWASDWMVDCSILPPGPDTLVVGGHGNQAGNFQFNFACSPCPCPSVPCIGTQESEPNGGPNEPIFPIYDMTHCGETMCGNTWALGGTRDTDWYRLYLTEGDSVRVDLDVREFDGVIIFLDAANTILYYGELRRLLRR